MKRMLEIMKDPKMMSQMNEAMRKMTEMRVTGTAGNGLVNVSKKFF
jgi:DNA-binding protein YbaB